MSQQQQQDQDKSKGLEGFVEQASLKLYSFGREMKSSFPDAAGRIGAFFGKVGKMGHFMRRDGWSSFTETASKFGKGVSELYMKATSTRAGALATGIAGGLAVWGVYSVAPPVALIIGGSAIVGSIITSGIKGMEGAAAQIDASDSIKRDRQWTYGNRKPASWTEYPKRSRENQDNWVLSKDDPAHGWYDEEDSAGKSWLARRPSDVGRIQVPLAAANVVMWGTNPAGLVAAAAFIFAPEAVFRGVGGLISGVHVAQDTVRTLVDTVNRGVENAREKIAAKEVAREAAAQADGDDIAMRPATSDDLTRPKGEEVEFEEPQTFKM
ncbi:MAG: hypothetical protein Alpg2KO_19990 [Alphaproteobacteria bacterium]